MSADLFAEFVGDTSSSQKQPAAPAKPAAQQATNFSFFDSFDAPPPAPVAQAQPPPSQQHFQDFAPASVPTVASDDDDDWGDFEGESSTVQPALTIKQDPFAFASSPAPHHLKIPHRPAAVTQDSFAFVLQQSTQSEQKPWQAPIIKAKKSVDPSVLFDAEDDADDDDDFGDFEGTGIKNDIPPLASGSSASVDLLGDLSVPQAQPPATSEGEDIFQDRSSTIPSTIKKSLVGGFGVTSALKQAAATTHATPKDNDSWDTFDDWEASIPTKEPTKVTTKTETIKATAAGNGLVVSTHVLSPSTDDVQPGELPPTNIPPPGVLLSLFPLLFADAQVKLFKPMAAQTLPMRNKLMADPATIAYLQGYLMLANVAAHIIAGRKLRWKRDQHLSQGMRIGAASSRATSGMKLTGIDKGESMKEEREASDVVRVWKEQVGRLRHVVSGANQIRAGTLGHVPDLQETLPVKSLKQSEGGIPARQPCMMCGLKREERVTATDLATDDSFGEWWIDQANMHRGCRNFWSQHKATLQQR